MKNQKYMFLVVVVVTVLSWLSLCIFVSVHYCFCHLYIIASHGYFLSVSVSQLQRQLVHAECTAWDYHISGTFKVRRVIVLAKESGWIWTDAKKHTFLMNLLIFLLCWWTAFHEEIHIIMLSPVAVTKIRTPSHHVQTCSMVIPYLYVFLPNGLFHFLSIQGYGWPNFEKPIHPRKNDFLTHKSPGI